VFSGKRRDSDCYSVYREFHFLSFLFLGKQMIKKLVLDFVRKLINTNGEDSMITHHMMNKRVSWNTLEKVKLGKTVHYIRKMQFGVVKDVSQCGNLCLVVDDIGNRHELEISECDSLD
jgi:hypothetical protein